MLRLWSPEPDSAFVAIYTIRGLAAERDGQRSRMLRALGIWQRWIAASERPCLKDRQSRRHASGAEVSH
jgi:hypothetical protein